MVASQSLKLLPQLQLDKQAWDLMSGREEPTRGRLVVG